MAILFVYILFAWIVFRSLISEKSAIYFAVFLIPLNNLLPSAHNFFGIISPAIIVKSVLIFKLWSVRYRGEKQSLLFRKNTQIIYYIVFVLFLYQVLYEIKSANLILEQKITLSIISKTAFSNSIDCLLFLGIFNKLNIKETHNVVVKAIVLSIIFVIFSSFFSTPLANMGLRTRIINWNVDPSQAGGLSMMGERIKDIRSAGFFSGGDSNALGASINLVFAFILLAWNNITPIIRHKWLVVTILFIGILYTGSRMGLGTFVLLLFIYIKFIQKKTLSLGIMLAFIGLLLASFGLFDFILPRFEGISNELAVEGGQSRVIRWILYFNYCTSDLSTFLFGSNSIYYVWGQSEFRDTHNYWLRVLFYMGFIFLTIIFVIFARLFTASIKYTKNGLILWISPIISTMFISQIPWIYHLIIFHQILVFESIEKESKVDG